jgi:hypothetical protein
MKDDNKEPSVGNRVQTQPAQSMEGTLRRDNSSYGRIPDFVGGFGDQATSLNEQLAVAARLAGRNRLEYRGIHEFRVQRNPTGFSHQRPPQRRHRGQLLRSRSNLAQIIDDAIAIIPDEDFLEEDSEPTPN